MTPARLRILLVALVVLVALAVTVLLVRGRPDPAEPGASPTATASTSPTPTGEPTPEAPTDAPTPSPTEGPTEGPTGTPDDVVLGLGGAFGDELWLPEERVLSDLTAALGPPDTTEESTACPDGEPRRVHRWDDLEVWVSLEPLDPSGSVPGLEPVEPPFVEGWALTGSSPALRTQDGLAVGSTVGQMLALYPDAAPAPEGAAWEVFRGDFSTLGIEATSSEPDGTVTALVSGSVCAPR